MIATALSYGKLLAIAALIIADARVPAGEGPEWFDWMRTNKLSSVLITFFACNAIEQQLLATGAFEVSLNGHDVFSKLQSGRLPSLEEMVSFVNMAKRYESQ
ncbi:thioredoxin reductase-like selenoprotein T1a [Sycon ciliatum]|uniref:thioredoxin reductase-like selenoprotein T1a n=1 Tax=Sycon ciliatum TaxID=27933 RepID=UPI0020AECE50|eukprot:scpid86289/ scgid23867/ Selenoprotein T